MAWLLPPLPPNFAAALRDVHARKPESRVAAAERLAQAEGDDRIAAREGLRKLAEDAFPAVRKSALAGLGSVGSADDLPRVLAALSDDEPDVCEVATIAAAQLGKDAALPALKEALSSPLPAVRFQAVASIAELAPADAPILLVPLLCDRDPEVRGQAVAALASLEVPHLAGQIARALDDASGSVQLEAALALALQGDARGRSVLLASLSRRHRVDEVAGALAQIGCEDAREPLFRTGNSLLASPHERAAAGAALIRLGDARGNAILRRVLRSFSAMARSYAVQLVRESDATALVDELARFVRRPRGVDPHTLIEALAHFSGRSEVASTALRALAAQPGDVGEAARTALRSPTTPPTSTHHT